MWVVGAWGVGINREQIMYYTATYSPDDNKLRLYASGRLDAETFARVKAAGFRWAPKQELFVAPAWSPEREDLLVELAGEIDDEDKGLTERAEERAERFDDYSSKRAQESKQTAAAVSRLADGIPLGQPILVGHHSERHARKDAERIENGMRKTVKLWETSQYWTQRAAGAIAHAKYKERPDVRARRIKGLEKDLRKCSTNVRAAAVRVKAWEGVIDGTTLQRKDGEPSSPLERALHLANVAGGYFGMWGDLRDGKITPERAQELSLVAWRRVGAVNARWVTHLEGRLSYERAMLAEAGGTVTDRTKPEKGGGVQCWASPRGGWSKVVRVNKASVTVLDNWGNGGADFSRTIPLDKLRAVMPAADLEAARAAGKIKDVPGGFFLLQSRAEFDAANPPEAPEQPNTSNSEQLPAVDVAAMRAALKAGIKAVAVPQLFETPADLARRMVDEAQLEPGQRILEPSAGGGRLLAAVRECLGDDCDLVAVDVELRLADQLLHRYGVRLRVADFLQCNGDLGKFDRILMNPPFKDAADVRHILHAAQFLAPGGRLVAICANGPRQREKLWPECVLWEDLPAGTFRESGTDVRTALVVIER